MTNANTAAIKAFVLAQSLEAMARPRTAGQRFEKEHVRTGPNRWRKLSRKERAQLAFVRAGKSARDAVLRGGTRV